MLHTSIIHTTNITSPQSVSKADLCVVAVFMPYISISHPLAACRATRVLIRTFRCCRIGTLYTPSPPLMGIDPVSQTYLFRAAHRALYIPIPAACGTSAPATTTGGASAPVFQNGPVAVTVSEPYILPLSPPLAAHRPNG